MDKKNHPSVNEREALARRPIPHELFSEVEDKQVRPASVTINKPVEEVWAFLRDLSKMPSYIRGLKSIQILSPKLSHWVFEHEGKKHEHDSEIIADEPLRLFAWKTVGEENQVGAVTLEAAPGGRGTMVSMRTSSDKALGKVLGVASYYAGKDPKSESYINLRRMKSFMETGCVPTTEGQSSGREDKSGNVDEKGH